MSKKLNRKKQLRNGLRRAGAFSSTVTKVVDETKKVVKRAEQSASAAGKAVSKKVEQAVEATKEQAQKVANSVEDFAEIWVDFHLIVPRLSMMKESSLLQISKTGLKKNSLP